MVLIKKLSRQEHREMSALHHKVKTWAVNNLQDREYSAFLKGLKTGDYGICMQMLKGGMPSGCLYTKFQAEVEWPQWLSNFDRGFRGC